MQYSVQEITHALPIHRETARRWCRRRRIPPVPDLALRLRLDGDLGMISPAWQGWKLHAGRLVTPEGVEWTCGQIQAWEFERQLLAQFKRERLVPQQLAFPKP